MIETANNLLKIPAKLNIPGTGKLEFLCHLIGLAAYSFYWKIHLFILEI